jgi:hypothetical protein
LYGLSRATEPTIKDAVASAKSKTQANNRDVIGSGSAKASLQYQERKERAKGHTKDSCGAFSDGLKKKTEDWSRQIFLLSWYSLAPALLTTLKIVKHGR